MLLVCGTVVALYSPWLQEALRSKIVERMNLRPGVEMTLDSFRLGFPLELRLDGLSLVQNGDTLVAASGLSASVGLVSLLEGEAMVNELKLHDGRFVMGSPDSAMYMTVVARELALEPVSVALKNMAVSIESGVIDGATVAWRFARHRRHSVQAVRSHGDEHKAGKSRAPRLHIQHEASACNRLARRDYSRWQADRRAHRPQVAARQARMLQRAGARGCLYSPRPGDGGSDTDGGDR